MRRISLRLKFAVLLLGVVAVVLFVSTTVNSHIQQRQAEAEMLEKAQILSSQLDSFWTFMEINEKRINTDSLGNYDFKGLYCVVAAKSVSSLFTSKTDYRIHYTALNPRRASDAPDEFEAQALGEFEADLNKKERYALTEFDGVEAFRYVQPLYITESCLTCHGEPKGEEDAFGFSKEGMKEGDVVGAVSIVMPVDTYLVGLRNNSIQTALLLVVLLMVCAIAIYWGVSYLVTRPLARLEAAARQIEAGNFDIEVKEVGWRDEIQDLSFYLDKMAVQLSSFYSELENKIIKRTSQLKEANKELDIRQHQLSLVNAQLQKENEYKSDYLAIMSHELRTPLTAILAFTDLWEKHSYGTADASNKEEDLVKEIKINGQILLSIVNNILEMSHIDSKKAELLLEQVDLVDVFGQVERTIRPLANRKTITLSFEVAREVPVIVADWEKLRRIVENLVMNAVKYTHRGGQVEVTAETNDEEKQIFIEIKDNGIGIEEENIAHIFQKFEQEGQSYRRRHKGSGLGLAVVKELSEMHQGSVSVKSVFREGSVFRVAIPIVQRRPE